MILLGEVPSSPGESTKLAYSCSYEVSMQSMLFVHATYFQVLVSAQAWCIDLCQLAYSS